MSKIFTYTIASLFLIFMLGMAFFSLLDDSAIMDEVSHLPAGYSYIVKKDMRINPEHPPLVKDLAGGAVWLWSKISRQPINFPEQIRSWQSDINGQWDFGFNFMYKSGNNADLMLFLGRLPTLLILLILGIYIFKWARRLFGDGAALISLFLYSFSPTFLAHGRLVTTDVAATAAIFIASYYFVRWLKNPFAKNLIIAGLIFGLGQLAKFSVFLLVPLFGFIVLTWIYLKTKEEASLAKKLWPALGRQIIKYLGGLILIMAIGYIFVVWPVYVYHILNYPIERQVADTKFILSSFGIRPLANLVVWLAGLPILRGLAEYVLGLMMVIQRAAGGNTTYFLGEVSAAGSRIYFPLVYLLKETLTLHFFFVLALIFAGWRFFKEKIYGCGHGRAFLNNHIAEILMLSFIVLYWLSSIRSPLNIGVRHVLPTFPFIFILIAGQLAWWLKKTATHRGVKILKYAFLTALLAFQVFSVTKIYPSFLAYFNELIGGPKNGYFYVTDSNLDWGQDLKRLAKWTKENNIDKIYVDYFGGGTPEYYLQEKFLPWHCGFSPDYLTQSRWLAVSATFLQGGRGQAAPGFREPTGCYNWLNSYQPITTIGYSIFVYQIK